MYLQSTSRASTHGTVPVTEQSTKFPKFSHRRSSFGRLFHTRTPSCANDLSPYLDVLDLGTTTGLVLLIEYLEVFSSMRFLMK